MSLPETSDTMEQLRIEVPRQTVAEQLRVTCPTCGAPPRELCVTRTEGKPTITHRARRRLAALKW